MGYGFGVAVETDDSGGRGQKPRALIVTVYGLYAREAGGWMSVETSRDDDIDPGDLAVEATRNVGRARLTLLRRS